MKRILVIVGLLGLLFAGSAQAQDIGYTRIHMRWMVRDIIGEPQTTYYSDSTINRLLNYAQAQTKAAMGPATTTAVDRQACAVGQVQYIVPSGAIKGSASVIGVTFWEAAKTTMRGLREVPVSLVGRSNGSYALTNNHILLGFEPVAVTDSVIIYYVDKATDLTADNTPLSVSDEDALAVVNLAISMLLHRDKQSQDAQVFYSMWKDYIDRKSGAGAAGP